MDHLNDKYHLNIPGGDYTTLGGYIMHTAERIPRQGEKLNIQNFEILITRAAGSRMEELELKVNDTMLA